MTCARCNSTGQPMKRDLCLVCWHAVGCPTRTWSHVVARRKFSSAVKSGKISKPSNCSDCGNLTPSKYLHGHHEDYSRPLDVIWLCRKCHAARHSTRKAA